MNRENEKVKFLLNWNHFSDHISGCMARLMTDSSYSDVIIATGDKRMIYAHQFVLANSSKYFQRLLKQMNKQRGVQLVVALPGVKYKILKILMNYMYRGESQVPHELLPSVIKTGRILEINGLIDLLDAEGTAKGASIFKYKGELQADRSVIHFPKMKENIKEQRAQDNPRPRDSNFGSDPKKKAKCQNLDIDSTSEQSASYKSDSDQARRFRPILPKNEMAQKEPTIRLPLKRKYSRKDQEKEAPSSSTENPVSKKCAPNGEETPAAGIKREWESWEGDNHKEEEVTVKTVTITPYQYVGEICKSRVVSEELPFEPDEVNYNELLCDFCSESYTNPSDWVRHMTDHHGDRGYQTYRDLEKERTSESAYTCVICSAVLLSAAEWARHLRLWHTDKDLAKANKMGKRGLKEEEFKAER